MHQYGFIRYQGLLLVAGVEAAVLADVDGWGHMGGWGWGMMAFGWLFMTVVVAGAVWLIWHSTRSQATASSDTRARQLLDERYARGDLDRDEYLERKTDLER